MAACGPTANPVPSPTKASASKQISKWAQKTSSEALPMTTSGGIVIQRANLPFQAANNIPRIAKLTRRNEASRHLSVYGVHGAAFRLSHKKECLMNTNPAAANVRTRMKAFDRESFSRA